MNNINILDKDPFIEENCKNIYRALLVVAENENLPINDILNILSDANKTAELLKNLIISINIKIVKFLGGI